MEDAQVQGMSVTVFNDNGIHYQKTFGYRDYPHKLNLTDSTNIYGASLSKAVFSVLVMKLVEEKVIDLDTPLESYLPRKIYEYPPQTSWHDDFSALKTDSLYHRITARMCLSNTSGFPNWRWFEEDNRLKVLFEPGSRYSYSGEGFVYLQVVLEKLLGKGLEALVQEKIFDPLRMNRSSYRWQPSFESEFAYGHRASGELYKKDKDNEPRAASTLETTSTDYGAFMEAVFRKKIISDASWKEIFSPQVRIRSVRQFGPMSLKDSTLNDDIRLSYGLGWGLLQSPYGTGAFKEGHGDGFQHYSIIFPQAGKGLLIMTNSDNGESIFKELLEVALGDTYTPWEWENYIPYQEN
jgi:CubicO group peptidase (beta-lactamase class C family)